MKYAWAEGTRSGGSDPQEVGRELDRLRQEHEGALTAEVVVRAAEKKSSPLHDMFEWDDAEAAHQYRLVQAREIIRHIVVIDNGDKTPRRAYVQVSFDDGRAYVDTVEALKDSDLRVQVLNRARAEMESFIRRYQELEELSDVIVTMKKTGGKIKKVLAKASK